jgi:hypothetical protein
MMEKRADIISTNHKRVLSGTSREVGFLSIDVTFLGKMFLQIIPGEKNFAADAAPVHFSA